MSSKIKYLKDMKYCLSGDFEIYTPITHNTIYDTWFYLYPDGMLKIKAGFCWDGPSGPTFDTKDSLKASLVHDVFCICMRDGRLNYKVYQNEINSFFKRMCIDDGMPEWRAHLWYLGVEFGDAGNPKQGPDRKVHIAP